MDGIVEILSDELLAELAERMAPDFDVYEVTLADEVFDAVQAERLSVESTT